jgi:hypothetical protein
MRAPVISLLVCVCLFIVPSTSHAAAIRDAAKKSDVAGISAALDAGANINEFDGIATPLYYAVEGAQLGAAKLLMERGADVNTLSTLGVAPLGPAAARLFTQEWQVYRKMVDNDYLFHAGAYCCLRQLLIEKINRPFFFLDIACGDAGMRMRA